MQGECLSAGRNVEVKDGMFKSLASSSSSSACEEQRSRHTDHDAPRYALDDHGSASVAQPVSARVWPSDADEWRAELRTTWALWAVHICATWLHAQAAEHAVRWHSGHTERAVWEVCVLP